MDPEDLHALARAFLIAGPPLGPQMCAAVAAGDVRQLRVLVHRLAGSLGFFDEPSAEVARRLEVAIVRGTPVDLPVEVARLDAELRRVTATLEAYVRVGTTAHVESPR